ncbi:hypothetical protein MKX03_023981 [Papaver bracteatum]|nr:hypothetical protein MKX03_023981 [Papaver bracteatum]
MKAEKETVTLDEGKESIVIIGRSKAGHGGKYTWEGPRDLVDVELSMGQDVPTAIDEGDPNYVDEEVEEKVMRGDSDVVDLDMKGFVVGEVDVAKTANDSHGGVSRVDVQPELNV